MVNDNDLQLCSEYILLLARKAKAKITLKKLHIILYYAYVEYLIKNAEVMFNEKFYTWGKLSIPELYEEAYPTWMGDVLVETVNFKEEVLEDEIKKELLKKYYHQLIELDDDEVFNHIYNVDEVYQKYYQHDIRTSRKSETLMLSSDELYDFYSNKYNFKKLISNLSNNPKR